MHDLSCRTARVLLQAPDELSVLDSRGLERHLAGCPDCEAYRRQQSALDVMIRRSLAAATDGVSVRAQVRAQLTAPTPARRRMTSWSLLKPLMAAVPMAALAALLVVFVLPRLSGSHQTAPPVSATPFKAKRIGISYPVTIDATRPNHILVGGGGEVYESWNAGRSFRQLAPLPGGLIVRDLAIDWSDPSRYIVAAKNSIVVSDDAGKHWHFTARGLLGAENIFLTQAPSAPGAFYVGPSILWKSGDHGRNWAPAGPGGIFGSNGASGIQAIAFAPHGVLYTAIWNGGVAMSRDGGITWVRRSQGLPHKVLNVDVGPSGTLWAAATDSGVYRSDDGGLHWRHVGPPMHLYTTGVIDRGSYVLAGGNGGIFRSTDGGRHWSIADEGLPLASYVFGFVPDPANAQRVYVSLDDDGVFRSDDGGLHWQSAQGAIPATVASSTPLILFRRGGQVWHTDPTGADPGNLTVDTHVAAAAVAPDGASVAYTTGESGSWWLRVVASFGSAAQTLLTGSGSIPRQIIWSHDSTVLAVVSGASVESVNVNGRHGTSWQLPPRGVVLGLSADARGLLVWDTRGRVDVRSWTDGHVIASLAGIYSAPPAVAPDGVEIGIVEGNQLLIGAWGAVHPVASVPSECSAGQWSDNGSRILLSCGHGVQERAAMGEQIARIPSLPATAFWVPGSDSDLLFFASGAMWRWSPATGAQIIVGSAHAVRGMSLLGNLFAEEAATPTCAAAALSANIALGPGTGTFAGRVELTNHGSLCRLRGYPAIHLIDAHGASLAMVHSHSLPASRNPGGITPIAHTVRLAPGQRADVAIWWSNWCQGTPSAARAANYPVAGPLMVQVDLPQGGGSLTATWLGVNGGSPAVGPQCESGAGSPSMLQIGPITESPLQ